MISPGTTGRPARSDRMQWARQWDSYALAALLLLLFLAQRKWNAGITSDGSLYFAYLRSFVFDRDLQIGPEIAFLNLPPRPHYIVPVGPAILWAPAPMRSTIATRM